jgi:anhydro-N-acetylmuramic acid kinase
MPDPLRAAETIAVTPAVQATASGELFVGMMSGTSLDGVDAVLVAFDPRPGVPQSVLGHAHRPFDATLRAELLALNTAGPDELHRAAVATVHLAEAYARALELLREQCGPAVDKAIAIGAHGQTVRHRPDGIDDSPGYTVQLDPGPVLAERSGLTVVSDFRSQDVAAGGQGAPLVPPYHRAVFGRPREAVAVVNVGGMANVSILDGHGGVFGFDSGPGNVLLDAWCERCTGAGFDRDGMLAASGSVDSVWLARLLADPFFALPPPRSTGRDLFSQDWLDRQLGSVDPARTQGDIQATLTELTVETIADAVAYGWARIGLPDPRRPSDVRESAARKQPLWICGGGAFNGHLLRRLQIRLPRLGVRTSDHAGVPPMQVEACAFAWLARERLAGRPTTDPAVTGARAPRTAGAVRLGNGHTA